MVFFYYLLCIVMFCMLSRMNFPNLLAVSTVVFYIACFVNCGVPYCKLSQLWCPVLLTVSTMVPIAEFTVVSYVAQCPLLIAVVTTVSCFPCCVSAMSTMPCSVKCGVFFIILC